jgi:hypothetical protein
MTIEIGWCKVHAGIDWEDRCEIDSKTNLCSVCENKLLANCKERAELIVFCDALIEKRINKAVRYTRGYQAYDRGILNIKEELVKRNNRDMKLLGFKPKQKRRT